MIQIHGFCPMGCGETLFMENGQITCLAADCSRPDAASVILSDRETEHIVAITRTDFVIKHPLRERLDDGLFECSDLSEHLQSLDGPPVSPGRYRAIAGRGATVWHYDKVET